MKLIGEGRQSSCYSLDAGRVMLVAKNTEAFENYKKQKVYFDILDDKVDFIEIPKNAELIEPCEKYPLGAMTISFVSGEPPKLETFSEKEKVKLGKQIAKFIYGFQKVGERLTKREVQAIQEIETKTDAKAVDECLELLKKHFTFDEYKRLNEVSELYKKAVKDKTRILHHGDLNPANLAVDKNKNLVGVIDFEGVGFFIPEYKLKNQWKDETVFSAVINEYHRLGGVLICDKKFTEVCEIITMMINLRRFYDFGDAFIDRRIGIIRKLLKEYFGSDIVDS